MFFTQNFDANLVVIVILAGEAIFANFDWKCGKHINLHNSNNLCGGQPYGGHTSSEET